MLNTCKKCVSDVIIVENNTVDPYKVANRNCHC